MKWPSLVFPGAFLRAFGPLWRAGACVTVVTFRLLHNVQIDVRSTKCDTVVTFGAPAAAPVALRAGARVTVVSLAMLQEVKLDVRSTKCDTVVTFEARAAAPATLRAGARVTVVTFEALLIMKVEQI